MPFSLLQMIIRRVQPLGNDDSEGNVPEKNSPCMSSLKGSLGSMNHSSNIKEFVAQHCRGWNITWALIHVNACNLLEGLN